MGWLETCWIVCRNTVVLVDGWIVCGNTVLEEDWSISPWIFSLLFFGNNSVCRIIVLVWMTGCMQNACGFDHMFSLLKRCKYSLYSDTMLNYWSTNHCWMELEHVVGVSNETNTDVCMYTWRIYSSRYLDTLLYKLEVNWRCMGYAVVYIQMQQ